MLFSRENRRCWGPWSPCRSSDSSWRSSTSAHREYMSCSLLPDYIYLRYSLVLLLYRWSLETQAKLIKGLHQSSFHLHFINYRSDSVKWYCVWCYIMYCNIMTYCKCTLIWRIVFWNWETKNGFPDCGKIKPGYKYWILVLVFFFFFLGCKQYIKQNHHPTFFTYHVMVCSYICRCHELPNWFPLLFSCLHLFFLKLLYYKDKLRTQYNTKTT